MCIDDGNMYFNVTGKIKWFNQFKGYGFVKIDNIPEDVFLHFSTIDSSGIERLNNDDIIICDITKTERGFQVTKISEIVYLNKHELPGEKAFKITATMKWFNPSKGFGFAQMPSGEDVFIHSNVLKKSKISVIEHGQIINILVRHTNFGYEALELISEKS